jgi:uncharacterized protein
MMNYERPGIEHTESTLKKAFSYALDAGIGHIVVASTTGYTAEKLLAMPGREAFEIVVVTHNQGFDGQGGRQFPEELRSRLSGSGIKVHTGTMVLRNLGTAIRDMMSYSQQDLVANTLRMFSQGVKVCVEIVAMAADAGLITFSDVVAVGGTGRGADTACHIKADSSNRFFNIKVKEIIIKPKEF